MKFTSKFFNAVFLAVVCATASSAAPTEGSSSLRHTTFQRRDDLAIESFYPESSYETFGTEGVDHPLSKRATFELREASTSFIASKLGVSADNIAFTSEHSSDVAKHSYLKQKINGVPVANAVANIAFNNANKVVSFGSSFVKPTKIPSTVPSVTVEDAIAKAEKELSGTYNQHPATLEFVAKPDGSVALAHVVQIENAQQGTWFEAFVDAHSGELVHITDFVAKASYRVIPIQKQSPNDGFEVVTDPANPAASPQGWHSDGTTSTTVTAGNNAISFKGPQTNTSSQTSATLNFIFQQQPAQQPTVAVNVDAARTNAFYVVNSVHDITYIYGFTESSFNFQNNNFGKGGAGADRVTISVQDSAGRNNADFATPPDGQSGRMRMFIFDITNPNRDGALSNDIVAHEATHGTTNRLTGGGTARCLQTNESGGMGEGWSDAFAEWTEHTDAVIRDFTTGTFVLNNSAGVRSHPYSTSATTNPLRYSSLQTRNEVHDIGEIWANILHNVYAPLVAAHGFSATARTDATTTGGNTVFMHLFIDALKLQPCNPTFLTARDSWIQADANRFGGANRCLLWRAFASRGLGTNAANHQDGTQIPADC